MKTILTLICLNLLACSTFKPNTSLLAPAVAFATSVVVDNSTSEADKLAKKAEIAKVIEILDSFPVDHVVTSQELKDGLVYALPKKPHWVIFADTVSAAYGDALSKYVNDEVDKLNLSKDLIKQISNSLKIVVQ